MNADTTMVLILALGFAWVFLLVEWIDFLRQLAAVKRGVLPVDIKLGDRADVNRAAQMLSGHSTVEHRLRQLLTAWSQGWKPADVVALSSAQSRRLGVRALAVLWFIGLVMTAALFRPELSSLAAVGLGVAGATYFLRMLVLGCIDNHIEEHLLSRLPGEIASTAMTAAELAQALGGSIDSAFKQYIPQPATLASTIAGSVETAVKGAMSGVEAAHRKLMEAQELAFGKWTSAAKDNQTALESTKKALEAAAGQLSSGTSGSAEKLQAALVGHSQQLEKAVAEFSQRIQGGYQPGVDGLKAALTEHAGKVTQANQTLATHLEKIQQLGQDIQKVLHVQQVVDGTLKAVSTMDEFKSALQALQKHLAQSDQLIRDVTKPRTIRLVETDGEVAAG